MPTNVRTTERAYLEVVRFLLFMAILLVGIAFSVIVWAVLPVSSDRDAASVLVDVEPGLTAKQIAALIADAGLVKDADLFLILLRVTGTDKSLQAGHYLLSPGMNAFELIEALQRGRAKTIPVTIPEGFALKQIAARLAREGLVDYDRFMELAQDAALVFGEEVPLNIPISSLEGYLFPDTYYFSASQTEEDIIRQMVGRFVEMVSPVVQDRSEDINLSLHEIVTLASIVEREVMSEHERAIVASVYLNRLAINMPLQADPTVRYVMTEERSRVLYRDLEIDSPYNTYKYNGLPPGPIASPGLASIIAVLEPADTDYLFFVNRGDGTHQFSRTFDEHVRARRQLGY